MQAISTTPTGMSRMYLGLLVRLTTIDDFNLRLDLSVIKLKYLLICGIDSLLHSVNLILFTLFLLYLILCILPQSPPSLSSPITPPTFHSRLETHLFHKSFPSRLPSALHVS